MTYKQETVKPTNQEKEITYERVVEYQSDLKIQTRKSKQQSKQKSKQKSNQKSKQKSKQKSNQKSKQKSKKKRKQQLRQKSYDDKYEEKFNEFKINRYTNAEKKDFYKKQESIYLFNLYSWCYDTDTDIDSDTNTRGYIISDNTINTNSVCDFNTISSSIKESQKQEKRQEEKQKKKHRNNDY
jgi:hypothetical protein